MFEEYLYMNVNVVQIKCALYGGQCLITLPPNKTRGPRVLVFSKCVLGRSIYHSTELNVHALQSKIDCYQATD